MARIYNVPRVLIINLFARIKLYLIVVLLTISYPLGASLPTPKLHPIEVKEQACRKSANDTTSILSCISTAIKEWDDELNTIYKKNMDKLDKDLKNNLKASQRKWLEFRGTEFKFYNKLNQKTEGSISGITHANLIRDFAKHRVQMLYQIYESDDYSGDSSSGYIFW